MSGCCAQFSRPHRSVRRACAEGFAGNRCGALETAKRGSRLPVMFRKPLPVTGTHKLGGSDAKRLIKELAEKLRLNADDAEAVVGGKKAVLELVKSPAPSRMPRYLSDGAPVVIDHSGKGDYELTYFALWRAPGALGEPVVLRHCEVTRFLVPGADLMLPGVGRIPGAHPFGVGKHFAVTVPGNPAPLAIGETCVGSDEAVSGSAGKFLSVRSCYRDALWAMAAAHPARPPLLPNEGFLETGVVGVGASADDSEHDACVAPNEERESENGNDDGDDDDGGGGAAIGLSPRETRWRRRARFCASATAFRTRTSRSRTCSTARGRTSASSARRVLTRRRRRRARLVLLKKQRHDVKRVRVVRAAIGLLRSTKMAVVGQLDQTPVASGFDDPKPRPAVACVCQQTFSPSVDPCAPQSDARRYGARPHATAGSCSGGRPDSCRRLPSRCVSSGTVTIARSSHLCPPRMGRVPRLDPSDDATRPPSAARPVRQSRRRPRRASASAPKRDAAFPFSGPARALPSPLSSALPLRVRARN